ncbi:MAG: response regulator transcription factor [Planctomycetota bacterium]|jgi:DNA-binding response OmpR family regulator
MPSRPLTQPRPDPFRLDRASIAVVEDDPESANILRIYLSEAGFDVHLASDGPSGIELAQRITPELVVLDLMLPGMDGWSVCRQLRNASDVPILILSARQEEQDRLLGLGLGADDYVVKPFSPREIVLRVQAILRRVRGPLDSEEDTTLLGKGPVRLDLEGRAALVYGEETQLTPSEFKLLQALIRRPGRTFERTELIDILYPGGGTVVPKAIDVHVNKLRQKIEPVPTEPRHLVTIRGFGYRFEV